MLFLGFSSGLPLALTGSTLQAWFTQSGVSLFTIGALSLIGMPYVWKFLWSPVLDRFIPPFLGRRRGWVCLAQISLCLTLFILAEFSPTVMPGLVGFLALLIAFFSASQDIAVDAYRTDLLLSTERGLGTATFVFAYRVAMLVSGGLALVLAENIGWKLTYELMALLIAATTVATFFAPEPVLSTMPTSFKSAIVEPFIDFLKKDHIILILLFIVLYKLGDALGLSLMSNFLLKEMNFSLTEVGIAFKTMGLFATILGAFAAGIWLRKMEVYPALILFGLAQAFSNLMFMLLALVGKNHILLFSSIFVESVCSGMSGTAMVVFLMSLCNHQYSATQYAVLSALSSMGRVFIGPFAAIIVQRVGWVYFFFWSFMLCLPSIMLISVLRYRMGFNEVFVEN